MQQRLGLATQVHRHADAVGGGELDEEVEEEVPARVEDDVLRGLWVEGILRFRVSGLGHIGV